MKGGKREGAGRPKAKHGETFTIRVPVACLPKIRKIVEEYKKSIGD